MTDAQAFLALQLVMATKAQGKWKWLDGMLAVRPNGTGGYHKYRLQAGTKYPPATFHTRPCAEGCVPDLADHATGGVLLGVLRAARTHLGIEYLPTVCTVDWYVGDTQHVVEGTTLGEAVARAWLDQLKA